MGRQRPRTLCSMSQAAADHVCNDERANTARKQIMAAKPWWQLGAHKFYHDGNVQPSCRGWFHGICAIASVPVLVSWILLPVPYALVGMLAAKAVVYAASAAFHLVCWRLAKTERKALIVDVSLVPLAIFGGVLPFSELGGLGLAYDCALGVAVVALNIALVAVQFRRGADRSPGDSTPRSLVCFMYYVYNEFAAGRALGFHNPLWQMTPVFYISAFLCAAGVDQFRMTCREPMVFPHHRKGRWSLHEDFHALLLIGDAFSCTLGWVLAFNPAAVLVATS